MPYWSERRRPCDGNTTQAELDGNLCVLRIERGSLGADRHLGGALGPGIGNGEFLGVDAVGAGSLERLDPPIDGALHGGRAGNAAADFVRQAAQIALQRGGLEGGLNDASGVVGIS